MGAILESIALAKREPVRFGTGGWRAIIGDGFTKENIRLLTAAVAQKMIDDDTDGYGFVIGYDRRFLSELAAKWAAEVMTGMGIRTKLINYEAPTPLIMFTVKDYRMHCGMAVTASHNPAEYNGIKLFMKGGRDADEVFTAEVEKYIDAISENPAEALKKPGIPSIPYDKAMRMGLVDEINPMNQYVDSILRSLNVDAIRSKNLKVVVDPMFGVSKTALQTVLMTARCTVDVINERRDALFGGRLPAPNVKTLSFLTSYVEEHNSDIGIATDGDADRLGVIDDKCEFLHPNKILVILYHYLLKTKGWHGPCVRNIATTHMLDRIAAKFGEACYEVPVGFKYISSKMAETNSVIGGESSGGLTVRGHIQGKDGIYAAALLVEMIAVTGRKLSEIYKDIESEFGSFEMEESNLSFSVERKAQVMNTLLEEKLLPDFPLEIEKVSYMDGCKVYFKNGGWIIGRFSGTEPLMRIFCEMPTMQEARAMIKVMKDFLGF
ncbi:MAG: phosphoglucomutase/phosphomannomutase family protein [Clostridiales bacterium]|nr:phosphoglucomutase/phosphomannomutase family protein [Clostridiales bacterium]MDR2750244.1 phosphoglucomutase/phosphomannomutase family protein [Clostridiales bacterium]